MSDSKPKTTKKSAGRKTSSPPPKRDRSKPASPLMKRLGAEIEAYRKKRGLKSIGLADAAEIDRTFLRFVEKGQQNVTIHTLERIAEALGVRPSHLIWLAEEKLKPNRKSSSPQKRAKVAERETLRLSARAARRAARGAATAKSSRVSQSKFEL